MTGGSSIWYLLLPTCPQSYNLGVAICATSTAEDRLPRDRPRVIRSPHRPTIRTSPSGCEPASVLPALTAAWIAAFACAPVPASPSTFLPQAAGPESAERLEPLGLNPNDEILVMDDMLFRTADVIESGFLGNPWPGGVLVYSFDAGVNATSASTSSRTLRWAPR